MIGFENVRKEYPGGTVAVEDFSLEIASHESVVLVGTSGSGKTTLMRMINRMVGPTSGRVRIDGDDVAHLDPVQLRRSIGYVMQASGLLPHRTVLDNVTTVPVLRGTPAVRPAPGPPSCWSWWAWTRSSPPATPPSSPAGSSSAWGWPARSPPTRTSC